MTTGVQGRAVTHRAKRRMLPFTDTDAYRNIKVATEAFVMANCGFLGESTTTRRTTPTSSPTAVSCAHRTSTICRHGLASISNIDIPGQSGLLPYLAVIRRKMVDEPIKQTDIGDVVLDRDRIQRAGEVNAMAILRSRLSRAVPARAHLVVLARGRNAGSVDERRSRRRFQNIRGRWQNDPLANMEVDPLRPLNNLFWGYIQDEQHRLSVVRRNYEYDHHYGLRLSGKAVNNVRTADSRSKFLEAFHTLLSVVSRFYRLDDDTTVKADAFPVLNALKEAHLILSQGAHNQFGDLPSTARIEMLMQQWILARPEFREFIPTRIMVAYPEPWMDRVDAMKKLQDWSDTSGLHFRNLAIFGEQVLLSVRFGNWADVNDPLQCTELGALLARRDPGLPARVSFGDRRRPLARCHDCADRCNHALGASRQASGGAACVWPDPGCGCHAGLHVRPLSRAWPSERFACPVAGVDARPAGRSGRASRRPWAGAGAGASHGEGKRGCYIPRRCICSATCSRWRRRRKACWSSMRPPIPSRAGVRSALSSTGFRWRPIPIMTWRSLERRLRKARRAGQRPVIVTDGFCPSCGQAAPLPALARLAAEMGGLLVIDDTQALGVLGREPSPYSAARRRRRRLARLARPFRPRTSCRRVAGESVRRAARDAVRGIGDHRTHRARGRDPHPYEPALGCGHCRGQARARRQPHGRRHTARAYSPACRTTA